MRNGPGNRKVVESTKDADQLIALEAATIADELRNPEGHLLIANLIEVLETRVEQLIINDNYCKGMLALVAKLNLKLNVGKAVIAKTIGPIGTISKKE